MLPCSSDLQLEKGQVSSTEECVDVHKLADKGEEEEEVEEGDSDQDIEDLYDMEHYDSDSEGEGERGRVGRLQPSEDYFPDHDHTHHVIMPQNMQLILLASLLLQKDLNLKLS